MKKIILVLICIIVIIGILWTSYDTVKINILWNKTVSKYIKESELWNEQNSYDAGYVLLVPMYYAFENQDESKMKEFYDLYERYSIYLEQNNYSGNFWNLNNMQFNFTVINYMLLCQENKRKDLIPKGLVNYLFDEVFYYANCNRKYENIDKKPYYDILKIVERDLDKKMPLSDLYQFELVNILNLGKFARNSNMKLIDNERKTVIYKTEKLVKKIYTEEITYIEGNKWIFQLGRFDNHEDYAYIGYDKIEDNMNPKPKTNTTWDVSHFSRTPVFLYNIKNACTNNENNIYYSKLIEGLEEQFVQNVLIKPDEEINFYRTTNYMNGDNGLYRYNYNTQKDNAYLPYQLSGTLLLGWWSFLGGNNIKKVYKDISNMFPLQQEAINTYVGPNTSRSRNDLVKWPDYFENGFAELVTLLASKLNLGDK